MIAAAYLVVVGLFGGGLVAWTPGHIVVMLATIALAIALAWRDGFAAFAKAPLAGRIALAGIAVLPLLQLIPLPPALWHALPGQETRQATLALAGLADSWQPITLQPSATAITALMAVGFVVFTGWLLRLTDTDFRRLLLVAMGVVLLGILVGLSQVASDGRFPQLQVDNMGGTLLGFFANKNHMGLVLACSILLFGLVISRQILPSGRMGGGQPLGGRSGMNPATVQIRRRLLVAGYTAFVLVAIVVTNSRAGLAFGMLAAVIVMLDLARSVALRWRIAAVAVIALLVVAVMSSTAFDQVAGRVDGVGDDLRWQFIDWTWPLAQLYAWQGSGFGSFQTLFVTHEQLAWVKPTIVNAVHNDYLQLLIEGGVPALVVLTLLVLSLGVSAAALRRLPRRAPARRELVAGLIIAALFALHSAIDYPLRRPAAWVFFALALAAVYRASSFASAPVVQDGNNQVPEKSLLLEAA